MIPAVSYALNKVLTAVAQQHAMKPALTDEDLAGHTLSESERTALKAGDIDALYRLGAEVLYEDNAFVHVSGHASQEDLKLMLKLTQPRYFVPVHGEYRHLLGHASGLPFEGPRPISKPGQRRIYSNTGFEVLAERLAANAEMPFEEYLRKAVLDPLHIGQNVKEVLDCDLAAEVSAPALYEEAAKLDAPIASDTPSS